VVEQPVTSDAPRHRALVDVLEVAVAGALPTTRPNTSLVACLRDLQDRRFGQRRAGDDLARRL